MAENIFIKELLDNSFSLRPLCNKLSTVDRGRPTPQLSILVTCHKSKIEQYTRHFFHLSVWKVWLVSGMSNNKFYCWSYLLFPNKY